MDPRSAVEIEALTCAAEEASEMDPNEPNEMDPRSMVECAEKEKGSVIDAEEALTCAARETSVVSDPRSMIERGGGGGGVTTLAGATYETTDEKETLRSDSIEDCTTVTGD